MVNQWRVEIHGKKREELKALDQSEAQRITKNPCWLSKNFDAFVPEPLIEHSKAPTNFLSTLLTDKGKIPVAISVGHQKDTYTNRGE